MSQSEELISILYEKHDQGYFEFLNLKQLNFPHKCVKLDLS